MATRKSASGSSGEPPPVVVKERRLVCGNSKWDVYFDHLADGRGNEVPDYLVIEPKGFRPEGVTGVCVLPVVDGQFALLQCYRHALRSNLWEATKGFIDDGEDRAEAALRELAEETGLSCAPGDLVSLGIMTPEASTIAGRAALFAATRCSGAARIDASEIGHGRVSLFDAVAMEAMAEKGGIEDAATLITYYRYRERFASKRGR